MREQPAANHSAAHPQPAPDLPSLIEQTRSGDLDSFAELVRRFQHMAHGYAYSVLGDFHWAEDAAQEAFVEAYLHMADLRHPEAFPGWLRRIVYKHCDRLRRKPRVAEVPLDEARTLPAPVHAGMHDPVQALEQQEMRDRVMQAVRALPAPQREATMLFYINGYSQNEIAEFLEVPVTTVQKRLHDSRKKLKERMVDMVENTLKSNTPDERFTEKVVEEAFEQLIRIKSPTPRTPMSLSPDGRLLAISVRDIQSRQSRMDVETQKTPEGVSFELIGSQVIIVDTKTGKSTSPFPEGNTSWAGQWSPDGKHLAAYVQHEGPVCLGIYDKDAKEYFFVREAPIIADFGFYPPQWTPDSKKVVVTLAAKGKNTASRRVQPTESVDRREDVSNIRVMSFDPDHADESNQAETEERLRKRGDMMDFGVFDVESKKIKRISQGHCICTWRLSPAGSHVAFHRLSNMYKANVLALFDVVVVDVDSKKEVTVAPGINRGFGELNWSPDGKRIAYVHTNEKGFTDVYVVPADGSSEPVRVSPENEMLICNMQETPKWSPDGRFVYCMGWGHVIRYASDGTPENRRVYSDIVRWVQPPMLPTFWSPDGKNLVALVSDKDTRKSGFVLLDLETTKRTAFTDFEDKKIPAPVMGIFGWEALPGKSDFYIWATSSDFATGIWNVRISQSSAKHVYGLNPSSAKPPKPAVKIIQFRAADGSECEAALYLPAKYKEGSKLPMIVHTYGGQIGAARQAATLAGGQMMLFPGSVSLLTNKGYAVLDPDLPLPDADHMRNLSGAVMPAVQKAIELGYADPDRLGLIGSSYAGYGVFSMLVQTSVFKAAVSCAGFVDLISMYCSIMQPYIEKQKQPAIFGTPWDKRDAYIENSPLFYFDRIKTPVLMICGTQDKYSAPQAEMAYYALKGLNQRVEMRLYEGEFHWPGNWSAPSLRDLHKRVMEWFDTYLAASEK